MEDKGIAADAMGSAKRWLASAKVNAKVGNYDTALYSLEMSVEIAFKALLLALGAEVPKTHFIGDFVVEAVKGSKRVPKGFEKEVGGMINTFNALVDLRSVSGYIFETKSDLNELKKKYEEYKDEAEMIVEKCSEAVVAVTS